MADDQFRLLDVPLAGRISLLELQVKFIRQQTQARAYLPAGQGIGASVKRGPGGRMILTLLDRFGVQVTYAVEANLRPDRLAALVARHAAFSAAITRRN